MLRRLVDTDSERCGRQTVRLHEPLTPHPRITRCGRSSSIATRKRGDRDATSKPSGGACVADGVEVDDGGEADDDGADGGGAEAPTALA